MELFRVNARVEKLHSEKKGTDYLVIKMPLSSDYEMTIFPKDAEKAIINRSDFIKADTNNTNLESTDNIRFEDFA